MTELKPLTLQELKRFEKLKKYRANARRAFKDLQKHVEMWRQIGLKYMAQADLAKSNQRDAYQLTWYIAKRRAIELGITTEDGLKHVRDIRAVQEWLTEMKKQFDLDREGK